MVISNECLGCGGCNLPEPVLRCEITGNPCGTDTWEINYSCQCKNCQLYLKDLAIEIKKGDKNEFRQ